MDDTQTAKLIELVDNAKIRKHDWFGRGKAAIGYYRGMAFAFARVYAKLKAGDPVAVEMARAASAAPAKDALAHYKAQFAALGMSNAVAGADTLRHLFVLLLGLGMRESSGQYCEGRDMSADNVDGDTCEAGLFQCSYNLRKASPLLDTLIAHYAGRDDLVEHFRQGVNCSPASWKNWGSGAGLDFQALTKACPAFAVEFAGVGLRNDRKHWGPINTRAAELRADADAFFKLVQAFVDAENIGESVSALEAKSATTQDRLIAAATGEWVYFGGSTRDIDNHWHVVGEEAVEPYRSHIAQYWATVGFPEWNGATPQPWSGAFVSWCFKTAGVTGKFNATHSVYIDRIRRQQDMPAGLMLTSPKTAVIAPGDLIWNGRDKKHPTPDYETAIALLKAGTYFLSHVDIVVSVDGDTCTSIGGNVSDRDPGGSVTRSTWKLKAGRLVDPRKTWIGVVKNGL